MVVRVLKYGSLALAILGVVVLLFVANRAEVPTVSVENLSGTMNWAHVRLEGIVIKQPAFDGTRESLKFWMNDGTGDILVTAYGSEAQTLLDEALVPVMGDRVSAVGTLRVRDEFPYLVLNDPQSLDIRQSEPVALSIAEVDGWPLYQKVRVQGVVRDKREPYEGLRILTVRDASGEIDVAIWTDSGSIAGDIVDPAEGESVQVAGAVSEYQGTRQIALGRGRDLVLMPDPVSIASLRPIGTLSPLDVGGMVAVEGTIEQVEPFSSGVRCTLSDDSGRLILLLWQDFYRSFPQADLLNMGTKIRALGKVVTYGGQIEVVPELSSDVTILDVALQGMADRESDASVPALSPDLTGQDDVQQVMPTSTMPVLVTATIGPVAVIESTSVARIVPAPVTDPTRLPLPTTLPYTSQPTLPVNPTPNPLATAEPSPSPPPTPASAVLAPVRNIGSITSDDMGLVLTIAQGGIVDLLPFSKGVIAELTDSSGSITLLIWQNVLEELPDRYSLRPGTQVQVTGEIDEYEGVLEIVPRHGAALSVLDANGLLPLESRHTNEITPSDEGRIFAVSGEVTLIEGDGWLKILLHDGVGEILVFIPERIVPYLPKGIGLGAKLDVVGEVDIYKGVLEIIPLAGSDVKVR